MSLRVQTVNHTLGGRLMCGKRDNAHEMAGKPKSAYRAEFFMIDVAVMHVHVFQDPAELQLAVREFERGIQSAQTAEADAQFAAAAAKVNTEE